MSFKSQSSISSALRPTPPTSSKSSILKIGSGDQLKLGITSSSSSSSTLSSSENSSSVTLTFMQDIEKVSQKIADLSGETPAISPPTPTPPSGSSTFVSGLRSMTINMTASEDSLYAQNMEKLMVKIGELDRLVLKQTAPESATSPVRRRSSRNADLHYIPTHLHLVDRLMDLYKQSKRVTIIAHGEKGADSNKENGDKSDGGNTANVMDINKMRAFETEVVTLKQLVSRLQGNEKKNVEMAESADVQMKAYKSQLTLIQSQLKTSQEKVSEQEVVLKKMDSEKDKESKSELVALRSENSALKNEIEKIKTSLYHEANTNNNSKHINTSSEIDELRSSLELSSLKLKESESVIRTYEMKLKVEVLLNEQIHDALKAKIESLKSNSKYEQILNDSSSVNPDNVKYIQRAHIINYAGYLHLKPETKELLQSMDEQIRSKMSCVCESACILSSIKDSLESELQNYQLERVLLNNDLTSVQNQLMTMKGAYHALETEHVQSTRKILKMSNNLEDNSNAAELQKRVDELQETVNGLQNEVMKSARRAAQYEKLPLKIAELEMSNSEFKNKISSLDTECESLKAELDCYKKLTQSLKDKIKSLGSVGSAAPLSSTNISSSGQLKDKVFFDSFEEVMQEEMMTMKMAFETKLRLAKEEADAATKRHLTEIQRMQASHIGQGK